MIGGKGGFLDQIGRAAMYSVGVVLVGAFVVWSLGGFDNGGGRRSPTLSEPALRFRGNYTTEAIRTRMDRAFDLYGVSRSEHEHERHATYLHALRMEFGVSEMKILSRAVELHVPGGVNPDLYEMYGPAVMLLKTDDK